ncbi:NADH-ubiquinone oxidoreductase subunit NDUFA12 family protein [Candidatus Pelagibacter bacterium nBUS_44]|uniref:NADH-ubiquinone oxidoreductase subunit NDUFA12 family protein n=1 Tax=Candidatus Pelagibacter bacterium nBUS_44 TaxID=3374195 RepID=UPI003EC02B71
MLTLFKKIFTWWNQDTFGTRLKTIFYGKLVGSDEFGNKYYESKKKRDGLFMQIILMPQKFLLNGIHGYILHPTK